MSICIFSVTYREFYDDVNKSLFPVCCAWIFNGKAVYPFTIDCNAIDGIIKKLPHTDREMIIHAFARNMVGEFLYKTVHPIDVRDFLKDTKYIFDALSERQIEIMRNIIKLWNEYDQKLRIRSNVTIKRGKNK